MAPKKTTTTKPVAKKAKTDPPSEEEVEKKKFRVQCKAGLLTYNNPVEKDKDNKNRYDGKYPPYVLETLLAEHHNILEKKFKHSVKLSSCVEKEGRAHWHTFFECDEVVDCDLQYFATVESGPVGDFVSNNGKNILQGHWYTQCVFKTSHIAAYTTLPPIIPKQNWLMDKWQQGKIEKIKEALTAAKLLKPQLVQWIDAVNNKAEVDRIQRELDARQARVQAQLKPFASNLLVDEWKKTFSVEELRYKFLVLCGASKMRKTEFAKSLFKNPFMHKDKVDWDGFQWQTHGCIIFDDINLPDHIWKYVRTNKVMFQSSSIVAVNTSATNCYKRDVCVVQTPIIICTNDGLLDNFVSAQYREWIQSNSVWLDVDEPMPLAE